MKDTSYNYQNKSKLFNGYIKEPVAILVLELLVGIAFLTLALWATTDILALPVTNEVSTDDCVLIKYECDGPIYTLESSTGSLYDLPTGSLDGTAILDNLIINRASLVIKYEFSGSDNVYSHDVLAIFDINGKPIVTQEAISEARSKNDIKSLLIIWSSCFVYFFFLMISYYIICNAPKYPRLASLLVREPYRNF